MSNISEKRRRIEELVLTVVQKLDNKKMLNYRRYKGMFETMSDKEFSEWASTLGHELDQTVVMYQLPFEEMSMQQIEDAAQYLGVPLEEYIWYRNFGDQKIRTKMKVPVGYINIKRVQQLLSKKNKYATDNEQTSLKSGQVTGDSKVTSISDSESFFLSVIGADEALKEFLGPRADNFEKKRQMYQQIARDGYTSLESLKAKESSSVALNTANNYFLASGIRTDLITTSLKTDFTLETDLNKK